MFKFTKTNIAIALTVLLTIFSFIPSISFLIKLFFGIILGILIYTGAASEGEGLIKKVQVFIYDVSSENKNNYKNSLLSHLNKYGETSNLPNEKSDSIEVQVETNHPIKTIQKSIDKLTLKIDHLSTVVL